MKDRDNVRFCLQIMDVIRKGKHFFQGKTNTAMSFLNSAISLSEITMLSRTGNQ
jgi:hypothetical protein